MPDKVLLVRHMEDRRDDRVAVHLERRGLQLHWCNPSKGDALPGISGEYAAAVVYGGIQSVNEAQRHAYLRAELDWIQRWVADDRPYLGLCLGAQLLATGETFPNQAFRVARRAPTGARARKRMPGSSSSPWKTGCWTSSTCIC